MKGMLFVLLIFAVVIGGCAGPKSIGSNLTPGMAKTKITKNVTRQSEILEVFGAPNIVTKNKSGYEVWTYQKMSIDRGASSSFASLIIMGRSSARGSSSSRTFTLMIEFDENDIVKDFSYRSSAF